MYNTPGIGGGVITGVVSTGTLATTGFDSLWLTVAAVTFVVVGFILIRASRTHRDPEAASRP